MEEERDAYLPKYNVSDMKSEPIIVTITMHKGLNAVTKTGPLDFITSPCTQ